MSVIVPLFMGYHLILAGFFVSSPEIHQTLAFDVHSPDWGKAYTQATYVQGGLSGVYWIFLRGDVRPEPRCNINADSQKRDFLRIIITFHL
jgi:hypothetical protein